MGAVGLTDPDLVGPRSVGFERHATAVRRELRTNLALGRVKDPRGRALRRRPGGPRQCPDVYLPQTASECEAVAARRDGGMFAPSSMNGRRAGHAPPEAGTRQSTEPGLYPLLKTSSRLSADHDDVPTNPSGGLISIRRAPGSGEEISSTKSPSLKRVNAIAWLRGDGGTSDQVPRLGRAPADGYPPLSRVRNRLLSRSNPPVSGLSAAWSPASRPGHRSSRQSCARRRPLRERRRRHGCGNLIISVERNQLRSGDHSGVVINCRVGGQPPGWSRGRPI